jgi:hypothetical protein
LSSIFVPYVATSGPVEPICALITFSGALSMEEVVAVSLKHYYWPNLVLAENQ